MRLKPRKAHVDEVRLDDPLEVVVKWFNYTITCRCGEQFKGYTSFSSGEHSVTTTIDSCPACGHTVALRFTRRTPTVEIVPVQF